MNFLHWKIPGNPGDLIVVKMNTPAFVRLLDPLNFERYQKLGKFEGTGGWSEATEVVFDLPYKGTFHLVIDQGGAKGDLKATVDITRR